ncbi:hypothetical protein MRX96_058576 [Rhipicephalus microplus]
MQSTPRNAVAIGRAGSLVPGSRSSVHFRLSHCGVLVPLRTRLWSGDKRPSAIICDNASFPFFSFFHSLGAARIAGLEEPNCVN